VKKTIHISYYILNTAVIGGGGSLCNSLKIFISIFYDVPDSNLGVQNYISIAPKKKLVYINDAGKHIITYILIEYYTNFSLTFLRLMT
jgi:hypothetical protein